MKNIDLENSTFWNEICGSSLAKVLGIKDDSPASLSKYDDHYLNYYSYLLKHVSVETFKGKSVMEVGLGYGTLSQKIAENCSMYWGLDIAEGPVKMVNKRISQSNLTCDAKAVVGSVKECPFPDETFDAVVAIGSLKTATSESEKKAFDTNFAGEGAPETQFFSIRELTKIMGEHFDNIVLTKENNEDIVFRGRSIIRRETMLPIFGRVMGLDTYFQGRKK